MRSLALALLVALAGPAHADPGTCAALAGPPHVDAAPGGLRVRAEGAFGCTAPVGGMTVTVCVDAKDFLTEWYELGCATTTDPAARTYLTGSVAVPSLPYTTLLRSRVTASDAAGDEAYAESAPVPWVSCACPVR